LFFATDHVQQATDKLHSNSATDHRQLTNHFSDLTTDD